MQKNLRSQRGKVIGYFAIFLFLSITSKVDRCAVGNGELSVIQLILHRSRLSVCFSDFKGSRFSFTACRIYRRANGSQY